VRKVISKIYGNFRDAIINNLLMTYNLQLGLFAYQMVTFSPLDPIITILASKIGVSKLVMLVIISFLFQITQI
jgi:hypothetical protein